MFNPQNTITMSKTIDFNVFLVQWNPESIGYTKKTTFWDDFSIAEVFGKDDPNKGIEAVKDTYRRAFDEWKSNAEYITELSLVMNHKCWYFYDVANKVSDPQLKSYADELSHLYADLYYKVDNWCLDHLKGADAEYYFRVTD